MKLSPKDEPQSHPVSKMAREAGFNAMKSAADEFVTSRGDLEVFVVRPSRS